VLEIDPAPLRPPDGIPSRNEIEGFAVRTRKNLDYIIAAHKAHQDVHIVTQLVGSLLGLVVWPFERAVPAYGEVRLEELELNGWPHWDHKNSTEPPESLWELIRLLRHATAHANVSFSSDGRYLHEVEVQFANIPSRKQTWPRWDGSIRGDHLLDFCVRLCRRLEGWVG
jgi:HEPN pEK499 p136